MYSHSATVRQHRIRKRWRPSVIFIHIHIDGGCDMKCVGSHFWRSLSPLLVSAGQVGVLHENIKKYLRGKPLDASYDGYASCPLVTGYDKCIMAEFDYSLQPKETFPFRQDCERYSMYLLKRDFMPLLYWHLMLNGYWNGPAPMRRLFSLFKRG